MVHVHDEIGDRPARVSHERVHRVSHEHVRRSAGESSTKELALALGARANSTRSSDPTEIQPDGPTVPASMVRLVRKQIRSSLTSGEWARVPPDPPLSCDGTRSRGARIAVDPARILDHKNVHR